MLGQGLVQGLAGRKLVQGLAALRMAGRGPVQQCALVQLQGAHRRVLLRSEMLACRCSQRCRGLRLGRQGSKGWQA